MFELEDIVKLDEDNLNSSNLTSTIEFLESGTYLNVEYKHLLPSDKSTNSNIMLFTEWLNNKGHKQIMNSTIEEQRLLLQCLNNLYRCIHSVISDIKNSLKNRNYSFTCKICLMQINYKPQQDFWECIQEHEHFELLLANLMIPNNNKKGSSSFEIEKVYDQSSEMTANSAQSESRTISESSTELEEQNDEPNNPFKFNFVVNYYSEIKTTIYPDILVKTAQKFDALKYYTIQKSGPFRGVCLLCPCSLIPHKRNGKLNKSLIHAHTSGQRHQKSAQNPQNIMNLEKYHDFWLHEDIGYQAHQVYFVPDLDVFNSNHCWLCNQVIPYAKIENHIQGSTHKNKVLKMTQTFEDKLISCFKLQMDMYGIEYDDGTTTLHNGVVDKNHHTATKENPKQILTKEDSNTNEPETNKPAPINSTTSRCVIQKSYFQNDTTLGGLLPQRYIEHVKLLIKTNNEVNCTCCHVKISANFIDVIQHINEQYHRENSQIMPVKYYYYCEICNFYFYDEFAWEGHFTKGPNRHFDIAANRQGRLNEYECLTCRLVIYGDNLSLAQHMNSVISRPMRRKEIKLPSSVKDLFKSYTIICDGATNLLNEANHVLKRQDIMWTCCLYLERTLKEIYPNCKAYAFGSRMSGLGNYKSDLDVFMDIGDMYNGKYYQDSQSQESFVIKSTIIFKKYKDQFQFVLPIPNARTPIVKLHHNLTDLDCDISFRHGLGVENTKFIRFCIQLQPITQPFILILKNWSNCCGLNEHITNYGLALMAIFFLQVNGYLLSVDQLRRFCYRQSIIIDGWETINYTISFEQLKTLVKPVSINLKQLLFNFFVYFAEFNYANDVVCPLLGHTIPKILFNDLGKNLPIEMKTYVQRAKGKDAELFRSLSQFCIQDPFDLSHNLVKACQQGTIIKWKTLCKLSYEHLDTIE